MPELTAYEATILDRVPKSTLHDHPPIASSEVATTLTEFAALHRLERKGVIVIDYEASGEVYVRRA